MDWSLQLASLSFTKSTKQVSQHLCKISSLETSALTQLSWLSACWPQMSLVEHVGCVESIFFLTIPYMQAGRGSFSSLLHFSHLHRTKQNNCCRTCGNEPSIVLIQPIMSFEKNEANPPKSQKSGLCFSLCSLPVFIFICLMFAVNNAAIFSPGLISCAKPRATRWVCNKQWNNMTVIVTERRKVRFKVSVTVTSENNLPGIS